MSYDLHVGDLAPGTVVMTVAPGDSTVDLSTVTAATFKVIKPDNAGTVVTWAAALSAQSASSVTLTYTLAAVTSDLDAAGVWKIYAKLTIPAGTVRTETADMPIGQEYAS